MNERIGSSSLVRVSVHSDDQNKTAVSRGDLRYAVIGVDVCLRKNFFFLIELRSKKLREKFFFFLRPVAVGAKLSATKDERVWTRIVAQKCV